MRQQSSHSPCDRKRSSVPFREPPVPSSRDPFFLARQCSCMHVTTIISPSFAADTGNRWSNGQRAPLILLHRAHRGQEFGHAAQPEDIEPGENIGRSRNRTQRGVRYSRIAYPDDLTKGTGRHLAIALGTYIWNSAGRPGMVTPPPLAGSETCRLPNTNLLRHRRLAPAPPPPGLAGAD